MINSILSDDEVLAFFTDSKQLVSPKGLLKSSKMKGLNILLTLLTSIRISSTNLQKTYTRPLLVWLMRMGI
jgi:hypothetical protein